LPDAQIRPNIVWCLVGVKTVICCDGPWATCISGPLCFTNPWCRVTSPLVCIDGKCQSEATCCTKRLVAPFSEATWLKKYKN